MSLGAGLVAGCAGASRTEQVEVEVATSAPATALPEAVRAVVPAWRHVDPAWLEQADVWLVAGFEQSTYPCVQRGDELDMFVRYAFVPRQVLKGKVAARDVDVAANELKGPNVPRLLIEGHAYLVLLATTAETRAVLADPEGRLTMVTAVGPGEVVAIVDLSQTEHEARAEATVARRSDGDRFSPAVWAAARSAATVTAQQHAPVAKFVAEVVMRRGTAVADVRAWLGAPDREEAWGTGRVDRYWLSAPNYARPVDGGVYGEVELEIVDGVLERGEITYFRWFFSPGEQASRELPEPELRALGLTAHRL